MSNQVFKWEAQVRDYEIDALGGVNHATYINYLEQARNNYARNLGVDYFAYHQDGYDFVVTAIELEFHRSLFMQQEFYVTVALVGYDEKRIHFAQEIINAKNDKLIAKAMVHIALVNNKLDKACMPDKLAEILKSAM